MGGKKKPASKRSKKKRDGTKKKSVRTRGRGKVVTNRIDKSELRKREKRKTRGEGKFRGK